MTFSRTVALAILAFFAFLVPARAADGLSVQGTLAIAKMAGTCGILNSMIEFQENTKLDKGEIFVVRFWATEAARLGMTSTELAIKCNKSVTAYDKLWKLAEQKE